MTGTICLSVDLRPIDDDYKAVICEGCRYFFTDKLNSVLENHSNVKRGWHHQYQKPWDCVDNAIAGKKHIGEVEFLHCL